VALGLARRLDRGRQRRVVAQHQQAPAAAAVLRDHLLHVQLRGRGDEFSAGSKIQPIDSRVNFRKTSFSKDFI
jgi:hypothetical protein